MNIFTEAAKLEEQNCPFAMAQIVDSRGSTPRHSAQMLVRADGSIVGTIGGGMVERKVIEESLQALQERKPRLFHGRMARNGADAVGSDCGGAMSVFISVHGMRPRLVLIGAGHVNRAIAQSAALLGFDIAVADIYRESLNPELFPPSTTLLHAESFGAAVEALDIRPDNFVLIATNNQDREALDKLIEQPIAWLGLLASRRKVQLFLRQLREKGVAEGISIDGLSLSGLPTMRAGTPAAVVCGGTGCSTTEPAPIFAPRPTSILPRIFAPAPIITPSRIFG